MIKLPEAESRILSKIEGTSWAVPRFLHRSAFLTRPTAVSTHTYRCLHRGRNRSCRPKYEINHTSPCVWIQQPSLRIITSYGRLTDLRGCSTKWLVACTHLRNEVEGYSSAFWREKKHFDVLTRYSPRKKSFKKMCVAPLKRDAKRTFCDT